MVACLAASARFAGDQGRLSGVFLLWMIGVHVAPSLTPFALSPLFPMHSR